jgi:hypothetical protein
MFPALVQSISGAGQLIKLVRRKQVAFQVCYFNRHEFG